MRRMVSVTSSQEVPLLFEVDLLVIGGGFLYNATSLLYTAVH